MDTTRRLWALMAILATVALTSFTVQAILDEGQFSFEATEITGKIVAKATSTGEDSGVSEAISKAADWLIEG